MKLIRFQILCFTLLIAIISCRKFVELNPPTTKLNTESVFANDETAIAALMGIYSSMCDRKFLPYSMALYTGLCSDELTNFSTEIVNIEAYKNSLSAADAGTNDLWNLGYNYIYQANAIIEGCTSSTAMSDSVKKELIAEGKFIRAFWYFYLVNLYGDVPLVLTTSYQTNATISRDLKELVYRSIISDLLASQANLSEADAGATNSGTTNNRIRPNKVAATALLARVYLYHNEFASAEQQATFVINNNNYFLVDPASNFLSSSKETIWQLDKPAPTMGVNTWEAYYFILNNKPLTSFQNSSTLSTDLINCFVESDKRKIFWIGKFIDTTINPNVDYYYPNKYKIFNSSSNSESSIILRLAEQYLIRAEARVQENNLSGAIQDIDMIRSRAGIPKITKPAISKEELLSAIQDERRLELFAEWGHRWLDLKRTGTINAVMGANASIKGTIWKSTQQLWPLPKTEILNDPNLIQNPGYN